MKLFYSPGACSMGIHVVLEEIGAPYETQKVDLKSGEQTKPEFQAINPKGKVPTLQRDDGSVLTEYPVIAQYLAETSPQAKLWPTDREDRLRAAEAMDYCVATIHMQGFSRLFRTTNFAPNAADADAVKARGTEIATKGFAVMDKALAGREWLGGSYSAADSALFYVSFWAAKRMNMTLPPNVAAHFERMMARPAVRAVLEAEGLA
jgi:glutathione S-transferase